MHDCRLARTAPSTHLKVRNARDVRVLRQVKVLLGIQHALCANTSGQRAAMKCETPENTATPADATQVTHMKAYMEQHAPENKYLYTCVKDSTVHQIWQLKTTSHGFAHITFANTVCWAAPQLCGRLVA